MPFNAEWRDTKTTSERKGTKGIGDGCSGGSKRIRSGKRVEWSGRRIRSHHRRLHLQAIFQLSIDDF